MLIVNIQDRVAIALDINPAFQLFFTKLGHVFHELADIAHFDFAVMPGFNHDAQTCFQFFPQILNCHDISHILLPNRRHRTAS